MSKRMLLVILIGKIDISYVDRLGFVLNCQMLLTMIWQGVHACLTLIWQSVDLNFSIREGLRLILSRRWHARSQIGILRSCSYE